MTAQPDALRVETAGDARLPVVALYGDLTFVTAADLDPQLDLAGVGTTGLVIDVSGLRFCDSSGLAALIGVERRVRRAGGGVRLDGVHGSLQRLLRLTGVGVLFAGGAATDAAADAAPDAESG